MPLPQYAELHCSSNFSFLNGASHPAELVQRARELGYAALAITDECSLAGVVRAHLEVVESGCSLPLIIGAEMRLTLPGTAGGMAKKQASIAAPALDANEAPACVATTDAARAAISVAKASGTAGAAHRASKRKGPLGTTSGVANDSADDVASAIPAASLRSADANTTSHGGDVASTESAPATEPRLVVLAQTRRGYGNLSHWITVARRRAEKGSYVAYAADVEGKIPNAPFLAGLPECLALLVPDPGQSFESVFARAMWLKTWFQDRAYLAIELLHRPGEQQLIEVVRRVAALTGLVVVAAGGVRMHLRSRKALQDTLTSVRLGVPVAACGKALAGNAEQHLRSLGRLAALYEEAWLANTLVVAGRCSFSLAQLRYEYPREIVPSGHTPASWLRVLSLEGAQRRYPRSRYPGGVPKKVLDAIEHELTLIGQLEYEPYFLTVADIVAWARSQRILCQGRGSAANSAVCFCLGVTEVDPVQATMLFERFISAERGEPPDIDIDFEHQRREEVIQYIYGKYGRHRAALTGVVICYRPRSALRDVGRALGMDLGAVELVSKTMHWFDGRRIDTVRLREAGFDPDAPVVRLWMELTQQLIGFPRHLSQHPGGFVIARDQIEQLVPVENATMANRSVVQWDKDDLDALGLIKVDILALGMLSALRRSLDLIALKQRHVRGGCRLGESGSDTSASDADADAKSGSGSKSEFEPALNGGGEREVLSFGMQDVPDGDAATYEMACRADTVGVFQIESRAQMSMLPRLKPRVFYDLVVQVAIVRPGPIQGGMVHPYLKNREIADDDIDCPAEIRPALMRTKGVPIFQEQVMQIAMLAADFSGGEADALRRAMAAWKRRGGLGPFELRLVGRMVEKGYDRDYAERIFRQIEGFGEYGFPESHAVSFALLVYKSAWVKCHHPDAFLAGLLNSQPMGFYAPAQLVRDARAHGVVVRPVDVLVSAWESTLEAHDDAGCGFGPEPECEGRKTPQSESESESESESGSRGLSSRATRLHAVRLGLNRVAGLAEDAARRIVAARTDGGGPFVNAEDMARRAALDGHALQALAQADALRFVSGHRHQAAWAVAGIDTRPTPMLRATRVAEERAVLAAPSEADDMLADYRALGLTLNRHPLALLRETLTTRFRVQPSSVLRGYPHGRIARASGLVTHRQRPETAKGTMFVTLEDDTGTVNVIVWPAVVEAQRQPLIAARLLTVFGQWQREGEGEHAVMHLVAAKLLDHSDLLQGLVSRSRDFR
jgi:error-prone DNA polymerase